MDDRLFKYIFDQNPKMNPVIAEGVAVRQMEAAEVRIDRVWRCAAKLFPPGLEYDTYHVCTPEEEFNHSTKRRSGSVVELSNSDVYMVEFIFKYKGRELIRHPLYLPFCREAGTIFIRGSRFTITPVIADRCLSVSKGSVFFPPLRDRIIFKQFPYQIAIDQRQESVYIQRSKIHHHKQDTETKKLSGSIQAHHTLAHYLFARYGLYETFVRHFDCEPVFFDESAPANERPNPDQYVIVSSAKLQPRAVRTQHYVPTTISVAIPRDKWSEGVKSVVAAFFYVTDLFPDRVVLEDIFEPRLWRTLFGVIIFGASSGEGKILEDFMTHMSSLDEYIDEITREDLHSDNVPVDNIYELFVHIIEEMPAMLANPDVANMEGKRLVTWKYVLHDIVRAIFHLTYQLSPKNRTLQEQDLKKAIGRGISQEMIMKINGAGHPEVTNISSPSDSIVTKFTSAAIPQSRSGNRGAHGDHDRTFTDPSMHLHPSNLACGSFLNPPKSDPARASKLNMYGQLGEGDTMEVHPKFKPILNDLQTKLIR